MNMDCLCLFLLLALLPPPAFAETYPVGGNTGWNVPTDPKFYESWVSNTTFVPGDELVFKWTGVHDVLEVTSKSEYEECAKSGGTLKDKSPVTIPLKENGTFYFLCSIGSHCQLGQKVTIKVGDGKSTSTSASASPPPSKSSSNPSLFINYSLLLFLFSSFIFYFFLFLSL